MALVPAVSQVETLIEEKRTPVPSERPPLRLLWEDSGPFTQFLIRWNSRPKVFSITQIFVDELVRRRGLRAYGVKVIGKRRSKVNQLNPGVTALEPRQLEVANTEAA